MFRNISEIAFKRSPEWALARSVERGTVLKSPMKKSRLRRTDVRMPTLLQLCPLRLVFDAINAIERCSKGLKEIQKKKEKPTREINLKWVMLLSTIRNRNHPSRRHRCRHRSHSPHPQEYNF